MPLWMGGFEVRFRADDLPPFHRLQLWDRWPVRGTPFRAKAEFRINRRRTTCFCNFTESRKWYGNRQDSETEFWYEFCRGIASELERGYDGDRAYRPRFGHMIKRPEWGKKPSATAFRGNADKVTAIKQFKFLVHDMPGTRSATDNFMTIGQSGDHQDCQISGKQTGI